MTVREVRRQVEWDPITDESFERVKLVCSICGAETYVKVPPGGSVQQTISEHEVTHK